MKHRQRSVMSVLALLPLAANANLEMQGELNAIVPIRANLTLATCNLMLTDRSGMPLNSIEFEQIESGVISGPVSQTEFALTPAASSDGYCFVNTPDFTVIADFEGSGDGNIRNQGSAGNISVRLWGQTPAGLELFSSAHPTRPMMLHDAGRLWLTAELNPINSSMSITAGSIEAVASFDVVYK